MASLPTASSFWARGVQRCQSLDPEGFEDEADDDPELDDDPEPDDESDDDFEELDALESDPDELLSPDDELSDVDLDDELSPGLLESLDDLPPPVADDFARLSVLKNPDPLKLTPTGWNTFFTGITSPDSGCANSDSVSSLNDCWTSTVSSVSTNL